MEHSCKVRGIELKETEGEFYVEGLIATSHIDAVNDIIPKSTLDVWADKINAKNPQSNKVSYHHDRQPKVVGAGKEARVVKLPDGEWGLVASTHVNKTYEGFKDLVYEVENGFVDGFSIEYNTYQGTTTYEKDIDGKKVRVLGPQTELNGWAFASRPVQAEAVINSFGFKEILSNSLEVIQMETKEEGIVPQEVVFGEEVKPSVETIIVEEKPVEKEKEAVVVEEKVEQKETKVEIDVKELANKVLEEVTKKVNTMEVKEKVLVEKPEEAKQMPLEMKEFAEIFNSNKKIALKEQFKRAGRFAESLKLHEKESSRAESREFKHFSTNGTQLEYKSLGITTNQNTDTDYLQSSAELQDAYDPVIYNALNQATVFWNLLAKDDFSGKGNNQVQFTLKTAANTSAAFYTGNSVTTANVTRLKYQTKFKKVQVGVQVDGDMIAAAKGGPVSDVFAQEVMDATMDMLAVINAALFAEVGLETASAVIGLEYLADSAGNTSLYGLTRSAANKLAPDSAGSTYINGGSSRISMINLRAMIRNATLEGAQKSNLIFVTNQVQGDILRSKFDDARRMLNPTDTSFGFTTDLFVDGVPVFEDKDCNTDDWYCVDLETHRIAMWIPPTLEMLGKAGDYEGGFIKSYFAVYNRAPRRISMCYGNATS